MLKEKGEVNIFLFSTKKIEPFILYLSLCFRNYKYLFVLSGMRARAFKLPGYFASTVPGAMSHITFGPSKQ